MEAFPLPGRGVLIDLWPSSCLVVLEEAVEMVLKARNVCTRTGVGCQLSLGNRNLGSVLPGPRAELAIVLNYFEAMTRFESQIQPSGPSDPVRFTIGAYRRKLDVTLTLTVCGFSGGSVESRTR